MKRFFACLLVIMILFCLLGGCSQQTSSVNMNGLLLSEVVSSNTSSLIDPVFGNPDWVELYNASDEAMDLTDFSIYESSRNRFVFPEGTVIGAGEYLLVYCCESIEDDTDYEQYCTGFKLSKDGSSLTLSSPYGTIQELTIPEMESDISYGISDDGSYLFYPTPTPGEANTTVGFATLEEISNQLNASLKISEILPQSVDDSDPYAWVEVYNSGDTVINLADYYITENLSDPKKAKMPQTELQPGEYAVLRFTGLEGDIPFKISSEETTVALLDVFGNLVDKITWDAATPAGITAGYGDDGNVVYYTDPTPGEANAFDSMQTISITDGSSDVIINEILISNSFSIIDEDGDRSPWLELYNTSDQTINLSDYALSDDQDKLLKYRLPDIELESGGYTIVYLSGKDKNEIELHTNFKLGSDETQLFIMNVTSFTVQTIDLPAEVKDNISYGLSADGSWLFYSQPTPLAPNEAQGFTEIAAAGGSSFLLINEVSSVSEAKDGESDWVELYNSTSSDIDITGYYLSDTRNDLTKWPIRDEQIEAGDYVVIDSYQSDDGSGNLSISLSGETLYLSNAQGLVLDQLDTGVLRPGVSKGRLTEDDTTTVFFTTPTKGEQNSDETVSGYCASPLFNVTGGYQTDSVSLEITTSTPNASIYYTLDGSTPSLDSTLYTGPIIISDTQVVRAVACCDGKLTSDETVATYLFETQHSLPVICLSITDSKLDWVFGSTERKDKRESAGYVEYYEADGTLGVKFPAGLRIAGAGTRTYPQKSINLYLRGAYGQSEVTYPFFDGYDITTFKSLSLRNMGQDCDDTRLADAYFQMAVNGMTIDNMQTKFAVVYINGDYWGLYEFKENQNEDYFEAKYGIDHDTVEMARNQYIYVGESSSSIKHVLSVAGSNTANADIFEEYTEIADSEYFMDYLIASTFFLNDDYYNQKYAHTSDNTLKWRPLFYDLDLALSSSHGFNLGAFCSSAGLNVGTIKEDGTQTFVDTRLYYGFRKNSEWCDAFVKRYAEVLNTVLTEERLTTLFDEMVDSIRSEMPLTIERWKKPSSMSSWENKIENMRENLVNRRKYAIQGLQSYFNLSDEEIGELFPNG